MLRRLIIYLLAKIIVCRNRRVKCETLSVLEISKQDLINALDGEIATLEQQKRFYNEQLKITSKKEQVLKIQGKISRIEVQIAQKSYKVLKLREEINK